jgi:type II secretory ATPase GspE/PulE/Tfp pilus assembly ATPase PilB-like protein
MGVYELFFPNNEISTAIGAGVPTSEIRELATENGFIPLVENALEKVHQGLTTLDEVSMRIGPKFPHAD